METIDILIVDDHTLFRTGIRKMLEAEPGMRVVGEAATGREALEQAQSGALDPTAFGVPPKPDAGPDRRGPLMIWGVLGLTLSFCWLLIITPDDAGRDGRLFCDRGAGSSFVGTVARSISDRPDPLGCRR